MADILYIEFGLELRRCLHQFEDPLWKYKCVHFFLSPKARNNFGFPTMACRTYLFEFVIEICHIRHGFLFYKKTVLLW